MKNYIGVKEIKARPMNRLDYNGYRGWELPSDENGEDEGYLVEYINGTGKNHQNHDGYVSWSPKNVFEEAYRETDGLPFGFAIEALKKGRKVTRLGWNGNGMFLYYVPAARYKSVTDVAISIGETVQYRGYLALKTVQGDIAMWSPSGSDALADDWVILED